MYTHTFSYPHFVKISDSIQMSTIDVVVGSKFDAEFKYKEIPPLNPGSEKEYQIFGIRVIKGHKTVIRAKRSFQHQECLWGPKIRNPHVILGRCRHPHSECLT